MKVVDFPEEPGAQRIDKMAAIYATLFEMTEAEIDVVGRYMDALKLARAAQPCRPAIPLRRPS